MVQVTYDSNGLFDAYTQEKVVNLLDKLTAKGAVTHKYIYLYEKKEQSLSNIEKKLYRNRRSSRRKFIESENDSNSLRFFEQHKKLIDTVSKMFKVKPRIYNANDLILYSDEALVILEFMNDQARIAYTIPSEKEDIVDIDKILGKKYFLEPTSEKKDGVIFNVITVNSDGSINNFSMNLYAEKFENIKNNYMPQIQDNTMALAKDINNDDNIGKTIILSGPPGTGKSFWIKTFAREINDVVKPIIIPQASDFFYCANNYYNIIDRFDEYKKLMFIFEDTGALFTKEGRSNYPQAVSTMLNITDGLIGKGREDLFLFTYNETGSEVDDAIVRPGRCAAELYFGELDDNQIDVWLQEKKVDRSILLEKNVYTLADLYASYVNANKVEYKEKKKSKDLGFM